MHDVASRATLRPRLRFGTATLRAAFATLVFAGLGWSLFDLATQEIKEVRIHGALSEAERNEVGAAASAAIVAGRRTAADIVEAVEDLGWSHSVRAWRRWPGRMHVAVTREPLAARWGDGAYLTTSGEVVHLPDDIAGEGIPTLRTQQASGVEAMRVYGLLRGAAAGVDLAIVELAENALGEWSVQLDNEVRVMLGASELSSRFARFLTVWAGELAGGVERVQSVDARYPAGVAVAWAIGDGPVPSRTASAAAPSTGRDRPAPAEGCGEDQCPADRIENTETETLAFAELVPIATQRVPSGPPPEDE
ncbi:MAG: hypothetical protein F4Y86_17740 [Gammaproteobacteria bacterium]|nr:hypothetical protein [Gammaproteobacteria bacterium]MYB36394.1 hypothetical protein [Gammaproteobacteria bacterium]